MRYLEIAGKKPLCGEVTIQGSKNAALPILTACLLGDGPCVIENCPRIQDVEDTLAILRLLGCKTARAGHTVSVDASGMENSAIFGAEAERIRSSVLFLGALLGRMKEAAIPYPGGCAIGSRPIDLHLEAMKKLGVHFSEQPYDGGILTGASRPNGTDILAGASHLCRAEIYASALHLHGAYIRLPYPSVGATENTILTAVLADGETVIANAALEPEIDALCRFLNLRGADIRREGSGQIRIYGKKTLQPVRYRLEADRIVAGSYLLAGAACGGCIHFSNLPMSQLSALLAVLTRMGGTTISEDGTLCATGCLSAPEPVITAPYPGFPTDLQSPLMAVLCSAQGTGRICETMFENRFRTAAELRKMGADIIIEGNCARINGKSALHGAKVGAPDLRGGAALTAAALAASGRSRIEGYEYIARGYEDICRDFQDLGADIRLTDDGDKKVW